MSLPVQVMVVARDGDVGAKSSDVAVVQRTSGHRLDRGELRAAVADGATVGFDADRWARMVAARIAGLTSKLWSESTFRAVMAEAQLEWAANPPPFRTLFHEEAWRRGASTTVAAMAIVGGRRSWRLRTLTVGDSVVAVVRRGRLVGTAPRVENLRFGLHPELVSTNGPLPTPTIGRFRLREDDQVLVLTDALAEWALSDPSSWSLLCTVQPSRFRPSVVRLRESGHIAEDDVLLLRATVNRAVCLSGKENNLFARNCMDKGLVV